MTRRRGGPPVRLLDADPELGVLLSGEERAALAGLTVPVITASRGRWPANALGRAEDDAIGVLVLEGAIALRVTHGERSHLEVLGPGDVAQPWLRLTRNVTVESELAWRVLLPSRLAVLDTAFVAACAEHPELLTTVMHRLVMRSRRLGAQVAIVAIPRVSERLLELLWYLADRFGRMTPDGALLELPLSHRDLAELVAARRPTVSAALADLAARGLVTREGRVWLLRGGPPRAG